MSGFYLRPSHYCQKTVKTPPAQTVTFSTGFEDDVEDCDLEAAGRAQATSWDDAVGRFAAKARSVVVACVYMRRGGGGGGRLIYGRGVHYFAKKLVDRG